MSYIDSRPPLMPQQHQYIPGSDAIGIRPQVQANGNEHSESSSKCDHQLPLKRPRIFDDNQCISSVPVNRRTANIFFKTRFCAKFKTGTCRNGEDCNFAHGMQDLRQPQLVGSSVCSEEDRPPGNWDDDQRIIHRMKLCNKYYNGEECPYGDRCSFLHEDPSNFRDRENSRESAAISIGTSGSPMGHDLDAARANMKPAVYWKTKLCTKWEITGHCPFGDKCHFAHGLAELQVCSGEVENAGSVLTNQPSFPPGCTSPRKRANLPTSVEESLRNRCFLKLKDHKKLNMIYADWPDDFPLMRISSNHAES